MKSTRDGSSGMWRYVHSGLTIASELHLPEWSQCEQAAPDGLPDVEIRLKEASETESEGAGATPLVTPREFRLRVPRIGQLDVRDGREVEVRVLPYADLGSIRPWLLGSAWGALCYQRGLFMVHASAVRIGGEVVLFCGAAGRGKSTLAAQLAERGHAVIGDDLCRLDLPPGDPVMVYPSAPRMKLWSDALGELGWSKRELATDHLRQGKFHLSVAGLTPTEALPVRAAYSLAWGEFQVRPLQGLAAFRNFLTTATWRQRLLESMGLIHLHSRRSVEFLRRVPFAELTRVRDFAASARTLDFLGGG